MYGKSSLFKAFRPNSNGGCKIECKQQFALEEMFVIVFFDII